MIGKSIALIAHSSYEESFQKIKAELPAIKWETVPNLSSEQLLDQVSQQQYDCLAVDETIFQANRHLYDNLAVKLTIETGSHAWPFSENSVELLQAAELWFSTDTRRAAIASLHDKYYGSLVKHDVYDTYIFKKRIDSILPEYKDLIEKASVKSGLPFDLLAAVSYQESHWDPKSRSPTGVRGFMMLTIPTAKSVGVKNRLDAEQSMLGGAKYLAKLYDRFPSFLPEEDRMWFALASYNVGYYHLQDARHLAIDLNKDPNRWVDVKTVLPLLSNKKYYRRTKYGYARGHEPVNYVRNIRNYMRVLNSVGPEIAEEVSH